MPYFTSISRLEESGTYLDLPTTEHPTATQARHSVLNRVPATSEGSRYLAAVNEHNGDYRVVRYWVLDTTTRTFLEAGDPRPADTAASR